MARKTSLDDFGWLVNLIVTIIFPICWIWNGINRILKGKLLWGVLYMLTGAFFGIGWIIDIISVILYKRIKFLA